MLQLALAASVPLVPVLQVLLAAKFDVAGLV
jgi:hypothetical protein